MNPDGKNKTKWGQKFFVGRNHTPAFEEGRGEARDLARRFEQATGLSTTNLVYSESMIREAQFARWIQSQGHNAYYA